MPGREDPLPAFNFVVQLIDSAGAARTVAGFSECSGLGSTLEVQEYQEGGVNDRVRKFPTRFTYGNITLKRGLALDPLLWTWHEELLRGRATRRDGLILLLNEARQPVLAWKWERGLPVRWSGPALNAQASEAAVETLEIAHERLQRFRIT